MDSSEHVRSHLALTSTDHLLSDLTPQLHMQMNTDYSQTVPLVKKKQCLAVSHFNMMQFLANKSATAARRQLGKRSFNVAMDGLLFSLLKTNVAQATSKCGLSDPVSNESSVCLGCDPTWTEGSPLGNRAHVSLAGGDSLSHPWLGNLF